MRYRTIVADPPWPQKTKGINFGVEDHRGIAKGGTLPRRDYALPYSTMTVTEIAELPISKLAGDNSHLYLWTTNQFLRDSYTVATCWGFEVVSTLVWKKPSIGFMGGQFLNDLEFIQFCKRGKGSAKGIKLRTRLFDWPRDTGMPRQAGRGHSAKPEAFLDLVEQLHEPDYLELFARRDRLGWETWGYDSLNSAYWDLTAIGAS